MPDEEKDKEWRQIYGYVGAILVGLIDVEDSIKTLTELIIEKMKKENT